MRWWHALRETLDGRALRERVLIFAAAAGIVLLAGYEGLVRPVGEELAGVQDRVQGTRQEIRGHRTELQTLSGTRFAEEEQRLRERKEALRDQLDARREALAAKVGRFIRPRRLMAFFEDLLLARNPSGIRVLRVESLAKEAVDLGEGGDQDAGAGPEIGLFRKGVAVGYRGTFRETLRFLDRIEALDWAVQVTQLDYSVVEFPRAEVSLTAHTFVLEGAGADRGE